MTTQRVSASVYASSSPPRSGASTPSCDRTKGDTSAPAGRARLAASAVARPLAETTTSSSQTRTRAVATLKSGRRWRRDARGCRYVVTGTSRPSGAITTRRGGGRAGGGVSGSCQITTTRSTLEQFA